MALVDRKDGIDVSVFSIAGKNLLAQFTGCVIEQIAEVIDNSAVQDTTSYHRTKRTRWRITGGYAVELHASNLMASVGAAVVVAITSAPAAQGGTAYTGSGILTRFKHSLADVQTCDFEITGNGLLGAAAG